MKKILCFMFITLLVFGVMSCNPSLDSDESKISYSIGNQIGNNFKRQEIEVDTKALMMGITDILDEKEVKLTDDEMKKAMSLLRKKMEEARLARQKEANSKRQEEIAKAQDSKEGIAYLDSNKSKKGVKVTPSGLQYKVLREGKGPSPKETDKVEVHYKGTLIDGKEFDSSYKRKKTAIFSLDQVIAAWTEGIQLMKVGSKFEFVVPTRLGYGPYPQRNIPKNSVLIFEVELVKIIDSAEKETKK